eukprot:1953688-Prymnesium_polylepis.2
MLARLILKQHQLTPAQRRSGRRRMESGHLHDADASNFEGHAALIPAESIEEGRKGRHRTWLLVELEGLRVKIPRGWLPPSHASILVLLPFGTTVALVTTVGVAHAAIQNMLTGGCRHFNRM